MVSFFKERNEYAVSEIPAFEDVYLDRLLDNKGPQNMNLYAHVYVKPGKEVSRHQHIGESESYFILSGSGIFDDNGRKFEVKKGDIKRISQ